MYYNIHHEQKREHYKNNREKILEYQRNYMKEHPGKARLYQSRYKSNLKERLKNNIIHNIIAKAKPILEFDGSHFIGAFFRSKTLTFTLLLQHEKWHFNLLTRWTKLSMDFFNNLNIL